MEVGIVGLPLSGKTTVFGAATAGRAPAATRPDRPSAGIARVADRRLGELARVGGSAGTVEAEITYLDLPRAPEGFGRSAGIGGEMLTHLQRADALAVVARAFDDPSVPHVLDRIDPAADAAVVGDELALVDMGIIERRLGRLAAGLKGARADERAAIGRERELLERLGAGLENGVRVAEAPMSADERRGVSGFGLLTQKPLVAVANLDDSQADASAAVVADVAAALSLDHGRAVGVFAGAEVELAAMDPGEAEELRTGLGLGESGLSAMARACFGALSLITFFTVGPREARAWAVRDGACALDAAAAIHTDMSRGFIRAEVATCEDFTASGGESGARRRGLLRSEGRTYRVRDGDVIHVLFNV